MTTLDQGLRKLKTLRAYAVTLEDRRAYLIGRLSGKVACLPDFDPIGSYELAEIHALGHVLALMDAEWDNLARLRRNVNRIEGRLSKGDDPEADLSIRTDWEEPSTPVDDVTPTR